MVTNDQLQHHVRLLGDLLSEIISEDAGPDSVELIREIRELARNRRANGSGAEARLSSRIASLTEDQASIVARALSVFST